MWSEGSATNVDPRRELGPMARHESSRGYPPNLGWPSSRQGRPRYPPNFGWRRPVEVRGGLAWALGNNIFGPLGRHPWAATRMGSARQRRGQRRQRAGQRTAGRHTNNPHALPRFSSHMHLYGNQLLPACIGLSCSVVHLANQACTPDE